MRYSGTTPLEVGQVVWERCRWWHRFTRRYFTNDPNEVVHYFKTEAW